jgi:hypothetical protein
MVDLVKIQSRQYSLDGKRQAYDLFSYASIFDACTKLPPFSQEGGIFYFGE